MMEPMKTLLLLLATFTTLFAQTTPIPFGKPLTQGTTTIYCGRIDLRSLGGIFELDGPHIQCTMTTTNPATTDFTVTITTQDDAGKLHTVSDHTGAMALANSGRSVGILSFDTADAVLLFVNVKELQLMSETLFAGS